MNYLPHTGSPIPSSHTRSLLDKSNTSIVTTRKSPGMNYVGDFGFRVIKKRPILSSPNKISDELKQKLGVIAVNGIPINKSDEEARANFDNNNTDNASNAGNINNTMNYGNLNNADNIKSDFDINENNYNNDNLVNTEIVIDQLNSQINLPSSDSEEVFELDDYNKFTPRPNKFKSPKNSMLHPTQIIINNDNTNDVDLESQTTNPIIETIGSKTNVQSAIFGRIVKKAAVSSLGKLTGQPQTRIFCSKVYANFFKAFDEWNRQLIRKEEKKRIEKQKDPVSQSLPPDQLQIAKEKIDLLSREESIWKNESQNSQINNNQNSFENDIPQPLQINVDYNYDLTQDVILQVDDVCIKVQKDDEKVKSINIMADDIAKTWNEISSSNVSPNIDQLLGH